MSARSLNKVLLIGNLTRDPNLRYTPNGTAVCSFGLATNRTWASADGGEKQEKVEYHNLVAWGKLADICGSLLVKGDKVYVEGRIQTRDWKTEDGQDRKITEIVLENMMLLSQGRGRATTQDGADEDVKPTKPSKGLAGTSTDDSFDTDTADISNVEDIADDIPF
jgi:single-strand DNA-binding protein